MTENFIDTYMQNFFIYNNDFHMPISNYVMKIINEINDSEPPSVVVYPGGKEFNISLIIYYSILKRYKNYSDYDDDITHELQIGDRIYYEGRLGIFKGKKIYKCWGDVAKYFSEDIRNSYAVKIEFSHGSSEFIKENDFHKITKYNGEATRLNNMESRRCNKSADELIAAMNLKRHSVNTLIHNSILYVKNKGEVDDIVNKTKVSYGNINKENLTQVVPITYWQNTERGLNYAGNRLRLNPIMKITSKLENALEMLYEYEDINELVIDLDNYVNIDYNSVEQLLEFPNLSTRVVLVPYQKYPEFIEYFNDKEYNTIFVSKKNMENYCIGNSRHPEIKHQSAIFDNCLNKEVEFEGITIDSFFQFKDVNNLLKGLCASGNSDEQTQTLANKVFRLLSILKSYIYFDNTSGLENRKYIMKLLQEIETDCNTICEDKFYYSVDKLERLLEMTSEVTKKVIRENALADKIKMMLKYSLNSNILFLVQNNREKATVDSYIKNRYRNKNIACKTISKVDEYTFYDEVYIMGVIPRTMQLRNKLFSLLVSQKYYYIYHESYLNYMKKLYNDYMKNFKVINDQAGVNGCLDIIEIEKTDDSDKVFEDYSLISELSNFSQDLSIQDTVKFYFDSQSGIKDSYCDRLIDFNEYVGIFKNKYRVYKVNIEKKELEYIFASDLLPGDEILILNDEFKSGEFIEELMDNLLKINSFKDQHLEKIEKSKIWKNMLRKYIDNPGQTIKKAYEKLKDMGLDKTYPTFRNWIKNDYIVGPDSEKDYELIFKLCASNQIEYNWREIYEACNYVRRLHIKLRADIGRLIVESYFNDNTISENLSYLDIDFMEKVTICEVFSVRVEKILVPSHIVNSIKRKEN